MIESSKDLTQLASLGKAFIDASSIIYARKAGFFDALQTALPLCTIPEILEEVGIEAGKIEIVQCIQPALTNDGRLVLCAIERQLPLISEDKQILMKMKRAKLPYYNALMMLNWLLFKNIIDQEHYAHHYGALRKIARYSDSIWEYGQRIYTLILSQSIKYA
jgi:hypothetical protein